MLGASNKGRGLQSVALSIRLSLTFGQSFKYFLGPLQIH